VRPCFWLPGDVSRLKWAWPLRLASVLDLPSTHDLGPVSAGCSVTDSSRRRWPETWDSGHEMCWRVAAAHSSSGTEMTGSALTDGNLSRLDAPLLISLVDSFLLGRKPCFIGFWLRRWRYEAYRAVEAEWCGGVLMPERAGNLNCATHHHPITTHHRSSSLITHHSSLSWVFRADVVVFLLSFQTAGGTNCGRRLHSPPGVYPRVLTINSLSILGSGA